MFRRVLVAFLGASVGACAVLLVTPTGRPDWLRDAVGIGSAILATAYAERRRWIAKPDELKRLTTLSGLNSSNPSLQR